MTKTKPTIAYFSMEFAFHNDMPNYAGGLGVLAADMMHSCADKALPIVGMTLFYHQSNIPQQRFPIGTYLSNTEKSTTVRIEDRDVRVEIWQMHIMGRNEHETPIYFLTTNVEPNKPWDRDLTMHLYPADEYTRIAQEVILGIGGVRALQALGHTISHYHMNEGHPAFLTLELLHQNNGDANAVRKLCTFTTHTPVAAGFDRFSLPMLHQVMRDTLLEDIDSYVCDERFEMARLGFTLSHAINSVAQKHKLVTKAMFPSFSFLNITNGIYHPRWASSSIATLLDTYIPTWREDPTKLALAPTVLPHDELANKHYEEKMHLCDWINAHPDYIPLDHLEDHLLLDPSILTIGFARRYVPYKRHELIFQDMEKLLSIAEGRLQIIFAGRCHSADPYCNGVRAAITQHAETLRGKIKVVIIPDYDLDIAKKLVSGVDIWLNTPVPPREASGTSGMKAALNGVLNLSVADGWWIEGYNRAPRAGWSFAGMEAMRNDYLNQHDAYELLLQLEDALDCYYNHPDQWADRMTHAISLLAYFSVVSDYYEIMWS